MKKEIINFNVGKNKISLEVFKVPWWFEGIGLMFSRRKKAKALIFDLKKEIKMKIHSFFVFYPFFAIWLDENKKIIDIKKVNPFSFGLLPSRNFRYLIEVPINEKYDGVLRIIDGGETFK
jgi:uncharacterized membrane protein (UPF0127 family)